MVKSVMRLMPALLAGSAIAFPAHAQEMPASGVGEASADASTDSMPETSVPRSGGRRLSITPYIEAAQVLTADLSPHSDTLTYTRVAAGVDASINGRNTSGAVSLRYEHQFGWGKHAEDGDTLSGLARVSAAVIPHMLTVEAGGLATRTSSYDGGSLLGSTVGKDSAHLYSVYAGPSLTTHVGDVAVNANYRLGYSRSDSPGAYPITASGKGADESTQQSAQLYAGVKPDDVLPVGLGIGGAWYREDMSDFGQRISDFHVRADVTVPVSQSLALVGGIGYEKVRVSQRDVMRDGSGLPIVDAEGRYRLDKSVPRQIAYDVDGLIWDVGLLWRPSPRTSLEAHVGRRYGSATYYGNFSWQATRRSSLNVSVYDNLSGFGGQLNRALVALPTDFEVIRNPITGELNGCVSSLKEGSCIAGALGGLRSSVYRVRGISASYAIDLGRITAGIGAGYERRKYIFARDSVLGAYNGLTDKNLWLSASLGARIDERSAISTNVYANWYKSQLGLGGDGSSVGASAAYNRLLARRLTATAAVGIDGYMRDDEEDYWTASALVGMRYSF